MPICPFVRPSVCNALASLTIGRNPTKFGVRDFHMSGVCDSNFFLPSPWVPGEGSKVNYHILKVNFKEFLYQTLCLFSKIKEMGFSFGRLGWDLGLLEGQLFYIFFQTCSCGISN